MRLLPDFYEANLSDEEIITYMREDGITYQEIGKYTKMNRKQVSIFAQSLPQYDFPRLLLPINNTLDNSLAKCTICQRVVLKENMPAREVRGKKLYLHTYCHICLNVNPEEAPLTRGSLARKLAARESQLRNIHKATNIELPYGYFSYLFKLQKGLCFYTDEQLVFSENRKLQNGISIDRVIYSGKYEQGNIVFTINKANIVKSDMTIEEMKNWTPEWYKRATIFLTQKESFMLKGNNAI